MQGYKLSFFTQQDRLVHGQSIAQWIIEAAKNLGVRGATMFAASEGFGHDQKLHSVHFFELNDQPLEVTLAVTPEEAESIFNLLKNNEIDVFYTLTPIEFGIVSERNNESFQ
jgi:uncharacterized protein